MSVIYLFTVKPKQEQLNMINRLRRSGSTNRDGSTIIRNWENPGVIIKSQYHSMKTEKIKLVITVVLIILGTVGIFYSIIESKLDAYYLKKHFAYTISSNVYYVTGNKGGGSNHFTFF
jgi:hypothetical protein